MNAHCRRRVARRRDERGSTTIEVALIVPAMLVFLSLAILGGRVALAQQAVQAAAADAARTASLARTQVEASRQAAATARAVLANQGVTCSSTTVDVDTSQFGRPPGTAARVTATISCQISAADLGLPTPALRVSASQTSSIDTYRGR